MVKEPKKDVKQQIKGLNQDKSEINKSQGNKSQTSGVVNAEEIKIDGIDEEEEESEEQDEVEVEETEEEQMDKSASRSAPKIAQNTSMQHQQKLKEKQQRIVEMENMKRQKQDVSQPEVKQQDLNKSRRSNKSPAKKGNDEEEYYDEEEEYEEEEDNEDNKNH
uniref:Uncharacterized protein n=1 Tax=Strombidium inclinatum TaxID=197538 RepID=A0A7S3IHC2_9SPIT|mmetsp:Transcript_19385/g.29751  ORF Transcript_19385/g.29751 Transcript_19385/m.29751 type:complete len:163 (+) Transcript_19385:403-891(+)